MLNLQDCDIRLLFAITVPLIILFLTGTTGSTAHLISSTDEAIVV